jgi:hypothetical protein
MSPIDDTEPGGGTIERPHGNDTETPGVVESPHNDDKEKPGLVSAEDRFRSIVVDQLAKEYTRKASLEARGITIITTSSALASLLFWRECLCNEDDQCKDVP